MITQDKATWTYRKLELKKQIITFFHQNGATKEQIIDAAGFIKTIAEIDAEINFEYNFSQKDNSYIHEQIVSRFNPQVRERVFEFCVMLSNLHKDALQHLQTQRLNNESWGRDDFEYEDWLSTQPSAEIIIAPDKIYVKPREFIENLEETLPDGGTYLGSSGWEFPLSKRAKLEELPYLVLRYPDVGGIVVEKFDFSKFRTEKVSFEISSKVFNVSEGWGDEDDLGFSPLWRYRHSIVEFKSLLWAEIQKYSKWHSPAPGDYRTRGSYYSYLMRLMKLVQEGKLIKLLYTNDKEHALLIKRCIYWMLEQKK